MAHRASGYLMRSMMQQKSRSFSTSSSPPPKSKWIRADFAPVYIVAGFVSIAASIGSYTLYLHLRHSPSVYVVKNKRGMMVEADNPMQAVNHGGKLVDNSFLRKVGNIQEKGKETIPNPNRVDVYTRPREAETLESIK